MGEECAIMQEYARGAFAFWPAEHEQKWKHLGLSTPTFPQFPTHVWPNAITICPNHYAVKSDKYDCWEESLDAGRSYLVGSDVPMQDFIKNHRSSLTAWQKIAFQWSIQHSGWSLNFTLSCRDWSIYRRGDHVEFGLPHQDAGGERHYISRDCRTKILINVD